MTLNTRNLELMLRRLAAHPRQEARDFSAALFKATKSIAPSLVRYTEATDYDLLTRRELRELTAALNARKEHNEEVFPAAGRQEGDPPATLAGDPPAAVTLAYATPDADCRILAALLHSSSQLPLSVCLARARKMDAGQQLALIKTALRHLRAFDPVLREFEYAELLFELTVSATCFAQLKRHRMATLTTQDYDPSLGVAIPPSIREIGMEKPYREVMAITESIYGKLRENAPAAAPYILTNAHRRRVALKVNARELYHIARLRADRHAQWDIRELTSAMLARARAAMPLALLLATGKDGFDDLYNQYFQD